MGDQLLPLPLIERTVYLCVDMQRIFSAEGPWPTPWMDRVLPVVAALANRHPERTVFTRFIPPERPDQMPGMWRRYYRRWRVATRERLDLRLLELMPPLAALCPPARYRQNTLFRLRRTQADRALAPTRDGRADRLGIRDRCLCAATVLDAVDIGYRVIVVRDAVCSSSDEGHDMLMRAYHSRYTEQIETADAATILARWE